MSGLRILIGADTFPPDVNGAARFAGRLAAGLACRRHEVHVVAPSPDGPARVQTGSDGVTVHRLRSHRWPGYAAFRVCAPWRALPAAADVLRVVDPDVVHVQAHLVVGRGLAVAAEQTRRPLVATNHFMPENLFAHSPVPAALHGAAARLAWWDLSRVYRRADVVTAPTPRAVRLLAEAARLPDALPVSCGIDLDQFRPGADGPVPTVLFVGRLDPEKRVDELIRAFARLPAGLPARLEIVGDGAQRGPWTALAAQLGVAVDIRGFVDETELRAAYARAAVFCMPGIAELQSLATLEAMAAATPVVAADAMALPHLVHSGRNGYLFPPGDVDALAGSLATLLGDAVLRRRMGAASREIVAGHAMGSTLDAFEALYARVTRRDLPDVPAAA
jgi:glycosyltransferase involved in cell wall biosynthesis